MQNKISRWVGKMRQKKTKKIPSPRLLQGPISSTFYEQLLRAQISKA